MKMRFLCLISLALLVNSSFAYTILVPQEHWFAIANQLDQDGNTLDEILPDVPANTVLCKWDCAAQDFGPPYKFSALTKRWDPAGGTLVPGEGALLFLNGTSPDPYPLTFTGTPHIPVLPALLPCGCGAFNLLSRQTNDVGTYENITGRLAQEGAVLKRYDPSLNGWVVYTFSGGAWSPSVPSVGVGEAVLVWVPCCLPPPSGLTDWWTFDGDLGDRAGMVNNMATGIGTPTFQVGIVGSALCFNGIDDSLLVADQAEINFIGSCTNGAESFTIDAWIRAKAGGSDFQTLLDKRVNVPTVPQGYDLFLYHGHLGFQIGDGVSVQNHTSTTPDLRDGQWHFIAVTVARCGTNGNIVTLYVDGAAVFTELDSRTGDLNNLADLAIGQPDPYWGYSYYSGCLDELEIIKRALTPQEILDIFNAGSAGKCKTNCLEALVLTCATNKIVQCPASWNFDDPAVSDPCCGTNYTLAFTTMTNGTLCSNVFTRTWHVTDCLNRTATCSQTVTVLNTNPPVIQCPSDIVVTSCVATQVFYTVTASNACCTNVAVSCNPPSGTMFAPDTTTWVDCSATDCCTNTTNCSFTVTVARPPLQLSCATNKTVQQCKCDLCLLGTNAATETALRSFTGASGSTPGSTPMGALTIASDAKLYGTTWDGGNQGLGTAFRVNTDGTGYEVLHQFQADGIDGQHPHSRLVEGNGGALYGTTAYGGAGAYGTVYKLDRNTLQCTVLHHFPDPNTPQDGLYSWGTLLIGQDGWLYGTSSQDLLNGAGTVFKLNPAGSAPEYGYTILHRFSMNDGQGYSPYDEPALVQTSDGMIYGTTFYGGSNSAGVVFMLGTSSPYPYTVLHYFGATAGDGQNPMAGLFIGSDGCLYGTTYQGGANQVGTVFKLVPGQGPPSYGYTKLHDFAATANDGQTPAAGLVEYDYCGALFGTTVAGGSHGLGTVFKLSKNGGDYAVVYSFSGSGGDGRNPYADLVTEAGTMYGTTRFGGTNDLGTIFRLGCAWSFDAPSVVGGCCSNVNLTVLSTLASSNGCAQSYTRTWQAICNSNTATCSQTVTVVSDNIPPVLTCAADKTVQSGTAWTFDPPTHSDNCCTNVTVIPWFTITNGTLCTQLISQVWLAWDCCTNYTTCTQTVTVVDTTPPTIVSIDCVSTGICVQFSEALDPGSINPFDFAVYQWIGNRLGGACIPFTTVLQGGNTVCLSDFDPPLAAVAEWGFLYASDVKNLCGNPMVPGYFGFCCTGYTAPANDGCPNCTPISLGGTNGCSYSGWGSTICATPDGQSSCPNSWPSPDVWYCLTIPCAGTVVADTCGTNFDGSFDTVLSVHTNCPGTAANEIACNDDDLGGCAPQSRIAFNARPGQTYYLRVAGKNGAKGIFQLHVNAQFPPPVLTCIGDKTVSSSTPWVFDPPTVSAPCCSSNNLTLIAFPPQTNGNCCTQLISQVWEATCCSNTVTCTQTVTVICTTAPIIACVSSKTIICGTNCCGTNWDFDPPQVSSGCCPSNSLVVTVVDTSVTNIAPCTNVYTRTWQATDGCGQTAVCSQSVTVALPAPAPVKMSIRVDSAGVHITFPTQPCYQYTLFYTDSLSGHPAWIVLEEVDGDGLVHELLDAAPLNSARFYRLRVDCPNCSAGCGSGMAPIPAGSFTMGNCMDPDEGGAAELPLHTVYVSAFCMDTNLVSYALWQQVYQWATNQGYSFDRPGLGKAANYPAQAVLWYDVVKWCNARSEKEGLTPCYYTDASHATPYRSGDINLDSSSVDWTGNGYRLPTEAEWEKAARGGAPGHRFPWATPATIDWSRANYYSYWLGGSPYYTYDAAGASGYNPTGIIGGIPYTSPVGYFAPNGYGLYDMAGNLFEWCWDWYDLAYYSASPGTDPRGPASGSIRVARGGCYYNDASLARCASRHGFNPAYGDYAEGFRCVRGN